MTVLASLQLAYERAATAYAALVEDPLADTPGAGSLAANRASLLQELKDLQILLAANGDPTFSVNESTSVGVTQG